MTGMMMVAEDAAATGGRREEVPVGGHEEGGGSFRRRWRAGCDADGSLPSLCHTRHDGEVGRRWLSPRAPTEEISCPIDFFFFLKTAVDPRHVWMCVVG